MKFDNIVGNPMIHKNENGTVTVIHYDHEQNKITKYDNLTYDEAKKLPFMPEIYFKFLWYIFCGWELYFPAIFYERRKAQMSTHTFYVQGNRWLTDAVSRNEYTKFYTW